MRLTWRTELPLLLLLGAMFVAAALTWPSAPDRIPVHWGFSGEPDRYGGRFEGVVVPPLIALGVYLAMIVLPRIDPGRANYANFPGAYTAIRYAVLGMIAAFYGVAQLAIHGAAVDLPRLGMAAIGVAFLIMGNVMGKLRPNWFVGIRTPWTLASKESWVKTHRLGGWVFIVAGLAMIVSGWVRVTWLTTTALVGFGAASLLLIGYSYFIWRADPDKTPPAGTSPASPASPAAPAAPI